MLPLACPAVDGDGKKANLLYSIRGYCKFDIIRWPGPGLGSIFFWWFRHFMFMFYELSQCN